MGFVKIFVKCAREFYKVVIASKVKFCFRTNSKTKLFMYTCDENNGSSVVMLYLYIIFRHKWVKVFFIAIAYLFNSGILCYIKGSSLLFQSFWEVISDIEEICLYVAPHHPMVHFTVDSHDSQ